jgi:H+-translocating NAD(P) transhydrogenase subunit alpha
MSIVTELAILVLAAFVGFEVISKVPNTLHTPLMSGTNAIHGIVVLGGILLMHEANGVLEHVLLVIAITFGTINVVGGFLVTDRMLGMFKRKPLPAGTEAVESAKSAGADSTDSSGSSAGALTSAGPESTPPAELPAATKADPVESSGVDSTATDADPAGIDSAGAGGGDVPVEPEGDTS